MYKCVNNNIFNIISTTYVVVQTISSIDYVLLEGVRGKMYVVYYTYFLVVEPSNMCLILKKKRCLIVVCNEVCNFCLQNQI